MYGETGGGKQLGTDDAGLSRVQESDGFENETVAESGCPGPDAPKPLLREQRGEHCVVKLGGVSDDVMGSTEMCLCVMS